MSPRSGPSSADRREVAHTRPFSLAVCRAVCQAAKDGFLVVQLPVGVQPPEPPGPQTVRPFFAGQPRVIGTRPPARRCSLLSGAATPPVGSSLAESTTACAMQRHRFGQRRPEACLQYTTTRLMLVQPASPVQPDLVW